MSRVAGSENAATTELIDAAIEILEQENPMTVRQSFYRLVSIKVIENIRRDYQRVSRILTKARNDERCPFEWIVDRSRTTYAPNVWENPAAYAEAVKRSYRKDYWQDQPEHVEIWVEKDAVIGSIQALGDELGVTIEPSKGFQSTTRAHEIARRIYRIGKPTTIFFLGDHDPSGRCIEEELVERVQQYIHDLWFADPDAKDEPPILNVVRLAIHPKDIKAWDLPPLRVKRDDDGEYTDSRAEKFVAEYGDECVELDALPPSELRRRIREAVESKLDMAKWDRAVAVEKVELDSIIATVGKWRIGQIS